MPHSTQSTLLPLEACSSGFRWAMQFPTLEAAFAANPDPAVVLWFFLTIAGGSQAKKAALVPAVVTLVNNIVSTVDPVDMELVMTQLGVFASFESNSSTPPRQMPAYGGSNPLVARACRVLKVFTDFFQPSVQRKHVRRIVQRIMRATPPMYMSPEQLQAYFTPTVWAAIDAAS